MVSVEFNRVSFCKKMKQIFHMNNYFKPMIIKIRSVYKDKIMQWFIALVSYYRVALYNVYAANLITPVEQNVVLVMIR